MLLIFASSLVAFSLWADSFQVDEDLLPMAKNLPVFYDINGNKLDYISDNYISPDNIPTNLKNAFVALEDKRFYSHSGYDPYRIVGAVARNIKSGGAVEGASTITQQLVKNTHLTFEKTITETNDTTNEVQPANIQLSAIVGDRMFVWEGEPRPETPVRKIFDGEQEIAIEDLKDFISNLKLSTKEEMIGGKIVKEIAKC